jgi:triosephosphate isomerase
MGGNWKLNPNRVIDAVKLAEDVVKLTAGATNVEIAVFPPHPFLVPVYGAIQNSNVKVSFYY